MIERLDDALEISKQLARDAGAAILEVYDNESLFTQVTYKEDESPLTLADERANRIIVDGLVKAFPDWGILSEEEKDNPIRLTKDACFVIDPLDGTKEFLKRNGQFTVNIALSYKHHSVMGVIFVPVTGELYYAAEGQGSFSEDKDGHVRKLAVSDITDKEALRVVMSGSHGCPEMEALIEKYKLRHIQRIGSTLMGSLVA